MSPSCCHELFHKAEHMALGYGMQELQCGVYHSQAMIRYFQEDYVSSDKLFRIVLSISERLGGWYFRANAFWGIGKNSMIQNHFEAAIPWLEDSLALYKSAGAQLSIALAWSELAVCHLRMGNDQKSLDLLEEALKINREAGTIHNYQVVLANIGNIYMYRGNHLAAIEYYRNALTLAHEIKDPVFIRKWTFNIRLSYARLRQAVDQLDSETA